MDEDEQKQLRGELVAEYKEALNVSDSEATLVMALYKLKKIADEIGMVANTFAASEMESYEAMVCLDILLGAANEVKQEIKKSL